jgi:SAM-dependent methyltransferase
MQTVDLLRLSSGRVVALDLLASMLERTRRLAGEAGMSDRLETVEQDMRAMDFEPASFDLVWSEGALYFLGFANGLEKVRGLVRPGGFVAVSEAVWLRPDPPPEAVAFWNQYPEIDSVENKLAVVSGAGFESLGHFILPPECWTRLYYDHLAERIAENAPKWAGIEVAEEVLAEARHEIEVFSRCSEFFSYAFFIMRRPATTS